MLRLDYGVMPREVWERRMEEKLQGKHKEDPKKNFSSVHEALRAASDELREAMSEKEEEDCLIYLKVVKK